MRYLTDTHALIWWLQDSPRLSRSAHRAIADKDHDIYVSAATAWEIATKHRIGKLPEADALVADVERVVRRERFIPLPISFDNAERAGRLSDPHKDPFDRMLIAQALSEDLILVSNETLFDRFGVHRLW